MSESNLVMLRPVVVELHVSVEVPLLLILIELCFGMFANPEDASSWIEELHRLYRESVQKEDEETARMSQEIDAPVTQFINVRIFTADILQARPEIQSSGTFIRVTTPKEDLQKMHLSALKETQKIIAKALMIVNR